MLQGMARLRELEGQASSIVYEAYKRFGRIAMLWSMGKDSTALLHLVRRTFRGKLPFSVVHIDTSYKFPEIYAFRDRLVKEWELPLRVVQAQESLDQGMNCQISRQKCCHALKTEPLAKYVHNEQIEALLLAIRRDEHAVRAKERVFSPRQADFSWDYHSQPPELWGMAATSLHSGEHIRVHPLLEWTEEDVWEYIRRHKVPVLDLYYAHQGQRYRSVGCKCCCVPVAGEATGPSEVLAELRQKRQAERAGRAQDKENEYAMLKLRSLGYM